MRLGSKLIALAVFAIGASAVSNAQAQQYVSVGQQLFANQYTQGYANQATAQMYVSPVPVPQWVGHTYITYEPLYPHQFMYSHTDRYHSYYDGGRGLNSTKVHYSTSPFRSSVKGLWKHMSLPRP
ncbi:MAG TPA: hypothetical protein DDW52_01755 [Planctomycetaceae bacterium]|nr:hypothetical protein [Planctomycetaceae bacterium]